MDPLLTGAVVSIVFVILMIALASKLGRNRERSAARVEALRALVAGSSQAAYSPAPTPESTPAPDAAEDDEWDLPIREERPAEDRYDMPQPAAAAASVVATTRQFVVHIPDAAGASLGQVSFEQRGSQS